MRSQLAALAFVVALLTASVAGAQQRPVEHLPPTPSTMGPARRSAVRPLAPRGGLGASGYRRMLLRQRPAWPRSAEQIAAEARPMVIVGPARL